MKIIEKTVTINRNPIVVTMWVNGRFLRPTYNEPQEDEITLEDSVVNWGKTGRKVKNSGLEDEAINLAFQKIDTDDFSGDEYDRI